MGLVHKADLRPSKLELLSAWLPTQSWFAGDAAVERVATFRLDDPAGEVGIETFIVSSAAGLFQVPLTYRAAPLPDAVLVGELEHSVLGHRWVYDGPTDPVYVSTTTTAIIEGGHEVEMYFEDGVVIPPQPWFAAVVGSGPVSATGELRIARQLPASVPDDVPMLQGSWASQPDPTPLAWLI